MPRTVRGRVDGQVRHGSAGQDQPTRQRDRAARPSAAGRPAIRASPLALATSAASSRPSGRGSPRRSVWRRVHGVWDGADPQVRPTASAANSTGTARRRSAAEADVAVAVPRRSGPPGRPARCATVPRRARSRRSPVAAGRPGRRPGVGVGGDHQTGLPAQPGDRGDEVRLVEWPGGCGWPRPVRRRSPPAAGGRAGRRPGPG